MPYNTVGKLVQVIMLSDMKAIIDPTDTPDDLYIEVAPWITSMSGGGSLSMVSFDPNTLRRRREANKKEPTYNTTQYYILKPAIIIEPDWDYKPTGSTAHIDASVKGKI